MTRSQQIERTAAGCNLPVKRGSGNWRYRPVGSILIRHPAGRRPHVLVKVKDHGPEALRWRYLSAVVWQRHHGPLPEGMCLWFRDQNPLNCNLENLEAITMAERLRRNISNNRETCRAVWAKQAAALGEKYWRLALDVRRVKKFRKENAEG